jgi:glucose/arabinose dehydrogenase
MTSSLRPRSLRRTIAAAAVVAIAACQQQSAPPDGADAAASREAPAATTADRAAPAPPPVTGPGIGPDPALPEPFATESAVRFADVVGWPQGAAPRAAEGFTVNAFARDLQIPRWPYVLPNGDVLVSQARFTDPQGVPPELLKELEEAGMTGGSPNTITLLRDADGDGAAEVRETFAEGLSQPFGMLLLDDWLYVANTDALRRWRFREGQTRLEGPGEKVLDLPAGGYNNHWTRNVVATPDGSTLYVSVGSATNVDEEGVDVKDERRAAILRVAPDGSGMRVFASGLRNPNGMDFEPSTGVLWTVVNERDGLGDDLVPDYLTSVREGAFYGWPYAYWGPHPDPRKAEERPDLVEKSVPPDYGLGAHTASLGLLFDDAVSFPEPFEGGAFVAQHGSWNRAVFNGYRVLFVPFEGGRPSGPPLELLGGFVPEGQGTEVYGRPVGLAALPDGSLLVADDAAGVLWRVAPNAGAAAASGAAAAAGAGRPDTAAE